MLNYIRLKLSTKNIIILLILIVYCFLSIKLSLYKSIWRDEAFSSLLSQQNIIEIIKSTSLDYNPPLFYILLHIWQKFFGLFPVWQRLLPLLFSVLTIVSIYHSLPKLFKLNHTLFKYLLLFFLVSNGSIFYYSYELRPYSMLMFLAYLCLYWVYKYTNQPTNRNRNLFIVSSIALLYTQTLGIFWFAIVFCGLTLSLIFLKKFDALKKILLASLIIFSLYIPWLFIILHQYQQFAGSFWLEFKPAEKLYNLSALFAFNEGPLHFELGFYKIIYQNLYYLLITVLIFGFLKKGFIRLTSFSITLGLVFLYYISYYKPLFYGRYFVFLAPMVSILEAYMAYYLISKITNKNYQKIIKLTLFNFLGLFYLFNMYYLWSDYFLGVSRVDYSLIKNVNTDSLYTTSDLDIMSCMIYHPNCYFVKSHHEIKNYTGILQLQQKPILNSWENISGDNIGIIFRNDEYQDIENTILDQGYSQNDFVSLGDNTYLSILTKQPLNIYN